MFKCTYEGPKQTLTVQKALSHICAHICNVYNKHFLCFVLRAVQLMKQTSFEVQTSKAIEVERTYHRFGSTQRQKAKRSSSERFISFFVTGHYDWKSVFITSVFTPKNGAIFAPRSHCSVFIKTDVFQQVFMCKNAPDCLFLETRLARLVVVSLFKFLRFWCSSYRCAFLFSSVFIQLRFFQQTHILLQETAYKKLSFQIAKN